jgi:hypothetical protein
MEIKLAESVTTYTSGQDPKSKIAKQGFMGKLSSFWGWRPSYNPTTHLEKKTGLEFVNVQTGNPSQRLLTAELDKVFKNRPLSSRLESLFDAWLQDATHGFSDLQDRQKRIQELQFTYYNDPFISRTVQLVADEATQLDMQDRLISVESPDPRFVQKVYTLLDQWGITPQRIHGACWNIELFGESFWANKITDSGVEKIVPLQVTQILERLEFNPSKVAELLRVERGIANLASKDRKMQLLLQLFDDASNTSDVADMFETKLFGYVLDTDFVVPPWTITHFRLDADYSEFYPYGRPHLLAALAPFKQATSTMTLQSLARIMSFPVTIYKVKTVPGMDESLVWDHVNNVREEYDNVGVNPVSGQSEAYSVNTKIWMPDGLMDIDVKESKVDIDFIGDLEMYIDRIAVASGVPKGYLVQEWGGFGNSAVSLVEQYKPFARHVYTVQSAFLEGLSDLIRIHMAITREFPISTPFTLSMRFPAEEMSDDKRNARNSSIDLANSVMDLIKGALGVDDEELPSDVVKDILAKYTFLDPTDIMKWAKAVADKSVYDSLTGEEEEEEEEESGGGLFGGSGSSDSGGDLDLFGGEGEESETEEPAATEEPTMEESRYSRHPHNRRILELKTRNLNNQHKAVRQELREARLNEIRRRYTEIKDTLYFQVLTENNIKEFSRDMRHIKVFNKHYHYSNELFMDALLGTYKPKNGLQSLKEIFANMKTDNNVLNESQDLDYNHIKETLHADFRPNEGYSPDAMHLTDEEIEEIGENK